MAGKTSLALTEHGIRVHNAIFPGDSTGNQSDSGSETPELRAELFAAFLIPQSCL